MCRREHELPGSHGQRAGGDQTPGPDPIQHHAHGNLQTGVHRQLQHAEQAEDGGRGVKPALRLHRRHPERGALKDRHGVGGDPEAEGEPGSP